MPTRRFRKPHRVKRKKSIFRNRFFWLSLLLFSLLTGAVYFLFFSSYFRLGEVNVSGNLKVAEQSLKNLALENYPPKAFSLFPVQSILLFNSQRVESAALKDFPQINSISVTKKLPDKIIIEVQERSPFGIWCKNNVPCFYFDPEGIIFEEVPEGTIHNIVIKDGTEKEGIKLGEKIIEKNIVEFCAKAKDELESYFEIGILEYRFLSPEKLDAQTSQGWKIFFNPREDLDLQLTKLIAVLESEIPPENREDLEYVDLRFSRVYYFNKAALEKEKKEAD